MLAASVPLKAPCTIRNKIIWGTVRANDIRNTAAAAPNIARQTMGLRPNRSARPPQAGAISAKVTAPEAITMPAQKACAPRSPTPSSAKKNGRNGVAKEMPTIPRHCAMKANRKVRFQLTVVLSPGFTGWDRGCRPGR